MANQKPLTRSLLKSISPDQRFIRFMENLVTESDEITLTTEDIKNLANMANARAQQAIDSIPAEKKFGSFLDTNDQVALAINTPTEASFDTTQVSNGVSVSGSQISVVKTGVYKVTVRIQL